MTDIYINDVNRIATALEKIVQRLDVMIAKDTLRIEETIETVEKKPKYEWFPVADGGKKVRKCENSGCPFFLRYNDSTGKYQHGRYDPNTKIWVYEYDTCKHYGG